MKSGLGPRAELLLAAIATAIVASPFLVGDGVDFPDDAVYYTLPSWEWLKHATLSGESLWFVPGKLGGSSLFADVVPMGPFYPGAWLTLLLPVVPALGIACLVHALGTLLGVRWLARVHGASPTSATLAGAAVTVGPLGAVAFVDAQVDAWPTYLWFPIVLGCLERLRQSTDSRQRRRWIALGGMALAALILGSHLRLAAAACAALALWTLVRGEDLRGALAVGLLGVVGGAPGFVPMLLEARAAAEGSIASGGLSTPVDLSLGLHAISGWLVPSPTVLDRDLSLGTVLGIAAVASLRGTRSDSDRSLLVRLAVLCGLLVLAGTRLPGVQWLTAPLTLLTHPVNLVYAVLATVPLAVLGARGLDRLLDLEPERLKAWLSGTEGRVLALLVLAAVVRISAGELTFRSGFGWQLFATSLGQAALVAAALGWLGLRGGRTSRLRSLVFALALADLLVLGVRTHVAIPSEPLQASVDALSGDPSLIADGYLDIQDLASGFDSSLEAPWSEASDPLEPGMAVGAAPTRATEDEVQVPEVDGPAMQRELLGRVWPPHAGLGLGVRGLAGRSKLMPARQLQALQPLAEAVHNSGALEYVLQELFAQADALGARTIALHGISTAVWGNVLAFRVGEVVPRCYAPGRSEVVADGAVRLRRLLKQPAAATVATGLLEAPVPGLEPGLQRPPPEHLSCTEPQTIDVSTSSPTQVVLSERWHPGWQARTETGLKLQPVPVNQVHQGVLVDSGSHRVIWSFVPPGLRAALAAAALAWIVMLALLIGARRARPGPLASALGMAAVLSAAPATAAPIEGVVESWNARASYEVWLVDSLELGRTQPLSTASVQEGTGTFALDTGGGEGSGWLFLKQVIPNGDDAPIVLFLPLDLLPFSLQAPPEDVRFRSVSPLLAQLRARGEPVPGWWLLPLLLVLGIYSTGLIGRWAVTWRLQMVAGARALLDALGRASPTSAAPPTDLLRHDRQAAPRATWPRPPAPSSAERAGLTAILLLAALLRARGFFGRPFDLLEHTYGPGSRRLDPEALPLPELLAQALIQPSSVEVTHPPLYHWLLSGLGLLSDAEWLLRLPALLASLATVAVLWLLLRRVSRPAALLGAGLLALAAPSVQFGSEATPYAITALVAVGSTELLLRALESGTARAWRLWLGCLAVGFLCHYTTALFALAQVTTLGVLALFRLRNTRWLGALHRGLGAAMVMAPLPLAWSFVHFAWFDPVALDTRLFADTYPRDPGLVSFGLDFLAISSGVGPGQLASTGALLCLAGLGLATLSRADRLASLLWMAMLGAFVGGTIFFHANLVAHLDGRIFWGFRWVSWVLPLLLGLAALGAVGTGERQPLRWILTSVLGLIWLWGALPFVAQLNQHTTRPDYPSAAQTIGQDLRDRDAVATLPLWGQRGPLSWYLSRSVEGSPTELSDGLIAWDFEGKTVFLEAIHEGLPFETSARNAWFDRLWIAEIDERMFGRSKFSLAVADQAVDWAKKELRLVEQWSYEGLELYLFERKPSTLSWSGAPLRLAPIETELSSIAWLPPNSESCMAAEDGEQPRWIYQVRVPLEPGSPVPRASVEGGDFEVQPDSASFKATIEGGPCSGPAPQLELRP